MLPCIGTMLFTSIYGIVDGLCVSNFVGKTAFAAVNLIMPLPMLIGTVGFMLGTGGSAIVGITLGEGDGKKADRTISACSSDAAFLVGVVLSVVGFVRPSRPVAVLLGAKGEMLEYAVRYGRVLMVSRADIHFAEPVPELFRHGRKAASWAFCLPWAQAAPTWCWMWCWWGRSIWGVDGCRGGYLHQPAGGRCTAGVLFPVNKKNTSRHPSGQDGVPRRRAEGRLHQRLLRADDQPLHVPHQYPL